jgi:diaminobutyrate-2-oxoglutarate transaminase
MKQEIHVPNENHECESEVRVYNRVFPACFTKGDGDRLWDTQGRSYIDFLSGAGALNYGHNPVEIRDRVIAYLQANGVTTSLDMMTQAKYEFLDRFRDIILRPRGLDYKVQFTGPTGSNAVEAALKIARLKTGRHTIIAFTNGYHGVSLGALAATGNRSKRTASGLPLDGIFRLPFDGYMEGVDTPDLLERMLNDPSSGLDLPAAIILETVQAEGGLNIAAPDWLRRIADVARRHEILLIVDDIQTGCGRTGKFFSFEESGIVPDIVCLSKSISGMGLPMALTLLRPELDIWEPGQHNGTFRGNNLAFVAATAALEGYWKDNRMEAEVAAASSLVDSLLEDLRDGDPDGNWTHRGRGLIRGIEWQDKAMAEAVSMACFERGLIVETCGAWDHVLKILPSLTIGREGLEDGFAILAEAIAAIAENAIGDQRRSARGS